MPEADPEPYAVRFYFRVGLALLIPVAVILFFMTRAAVDAGALESAKPCPANTQDPASSCISQFKGVVKGQSSRGHLTISVGSSTVDVSWTCLNMSSSACRETTFPSGTNVVTVWWRGRIARLGMAEGLPSVVTDAAPEADYLSHGPFPFVALLALAPLVQSGLLRQAPMSVSKLIETSFVTGSPESREALPSSVILRVAVGGWGGYGVFIWLVLYLAFAFVTAGGTAYTFAASAALQTLYAPLVWICAGVIGFGAAGTLAYIYLAHLVRTSIRETVTVQRVKYGTARNGTGATIWYERRDGRTASRFLSGQWAGLEGSTVDVLTDPRSGKIRRALGTTPAQG